MPKLPENPNLDQLRRQAKELVSAARKGDTGALERIGSVSDEVTLAAAQLAIAAICTRRDSRAAGACESCSAMSRMSERWPRWRSAHRSARGTWRR